MSHAHEVQRELPQRGTRVLGYTTRRHNMASSASEAEGSRLQGCGLERAPETESDACRMAAGGRRGQCV